MLKFIVILFSFILMGCSSNYVDVSTIDSTPKENKNTVIVQAETPIINNSNIELYIVNTDSEPISNTDVVVNSVLYKSDKNGKVVIKDLRYGEYYLKIIPTDYYLVEEQEISVDKPLITKEIVLKDDVKTLNIKAVGDNLIHSPIYKKNLQKDGTYSFDSLFENVKKDIESADISIINQETILVYDRDKISSYPVFGTPYEMGNDIVKAGFDIVLHATNHTYDKGLIGIENTLDFWKKNYPEIKIVGINETEDKSNEITIIEKNGIKVAILNYTYGLNGFTLPKDKKYLVNLLDDKDKIAKDIQKAKQLSDIVIVAPHLGTEYVYKPSQYHKEWVNFFSSQGVDIVIATHPHVLEPYEVITVDGNNTLVYYSLGNFISNQDEIPRLLGGMANITIEKRKGKINIVNYDLIPLVTHYTSTEHTTYKLEDYTNELAKKHRIKNLTSEDFSVESLWKLFDKIINK